MKDSAILIFVPLLSLAFLLALLSGPWRAWDARLSDFAAFYASGRLVGTAHLYDAERLHQVELDSAGRYSPNHGFLRPPFHALWFWPLSRLSYASASIVWMVIAVAALGAFTVLWRYPRFPQNLWALCLSTPAWSCLINGQDVPLLLLWIALAAHLADRDRPRLAGWVLSLCAAKFQLFLLLPVMIVAGRHWKLAQGLAAGCGVLLAVSFAAAGASWPLEWFASVSEPHFSPHPGLMPNLRGAFSLWGGGPAIEAAAAALTAAGVWIIARRAPFPYALAAALAGGLLVSHHSYLADSAILAPAALCVAALSKWTPLRLLAVVLVLPPAHFAVILGHPTSAVFVAGLAVLVGGMVWESRRRDWGDASAASPRNHHGSASPQQTGP